MVVKPVFKEISYNIDPKLVFVLMPFGETWSDNVYYTLKKVNDSLGLITKRADDFFSPGIIIDDIWSGINEAAVIIADITKHNANVFYELGISHTLGKKVILIRQKNGETAPFDIASWRHIDYELTPREVDKFCNDLSQMLKVAIAFKDKQ